MNITNPIINADLKASKILLVDDEAANIKLLERMLNVEGYTNVISTLDSREVVQLVREHDVDLILLDLNMPKMDGYEVMTQLTTLANQVLPPVLILTAQNTQEDRLRSLNSVARDYVTKPFDMAELILRVRNLLEVQNAHKYMYNQNNVLGNMVQERTQDLQTAHEKLRESRLQVVRRLGRAAEYRDNETGLHIIRMSKMAALLAKAAGMGDGQASLVLHASPMHDIGKIGIPDSILLKPGKLDPDEWEIMKTHAQIGANILSEDDSELLVMARNIALSHHEKWDGSGYPNKLKGEAIPLVGRITALADVFDALTSERPYKKAWAVDDAVELIKSESGKHFDPSLVEHFLNLLPEIIVIRDEYAEPTSG